MVYSANLGLISDIITYIEKSVSKGEDMGKYDFDRIIDRKGTACAKHDGGLKYKGRDDLLAMWVADMDFSLPTEVLEDLHKRVDHGIFGYTHGDDEYYRILDNWLYSRHGYHISEEDVILCSGVVSALASAIRAYTKEGDAVIIQEPVYYPFRRVIEHNNRVCISSCLKYENGRYEMDFDDFEKKVEENNVKLFVLCSPHNPVGRVWTRKELEKIGDICLKHDVIIAADEIHCDITYPGVKFISFLNLDDKYTEKLIVFNSASKTFNVAGLTLSNTIIKDRELNEAYRREETAAGHGNKNLMGLTAMKAVYSKGGEWLGEMLEYIQGNLNYVREFIKENLPKARLVEPEGTYLVWIDFSGYGLSDDELEDLILNRAKLWLDAGSMFCEKAGQFERIVIACPREIVAEAFNRIKKALDEI